MTTYPWDKLFILQHRLQPLFQLNLLFVFRLWLFLGFCAFVLIDLERAEQDCRCEPLHQLQLVKGSDSLHIGVDGDTPPVGYCFDSLDVEDEERSPQRTVIFPE